MNIYFILHYINGGYPEVLPKGYLNFEDAEKEAAELYAISDYINDPYFSDCDMHNFYSIEEIVLIGNY